MLEALLSIISSSGFGAITGGIFGWLSRREDRKVRKQDQQFRLEMVRVQSTAETATEEARAFTESQKTVSKVADLIKGAVRPVITGILLFMVYKVLVSLELITGGIASLPAAEAASLYRTITLNIISLTATAVSWWFASRPSAIIRLNDGVQQ